jgi:hypothetical protein
MAMCGCPVSLQEYNKVTQIYEIVPKYSVNGITFGSKPDKIKEYFGKPDEISYRDQFIIWDYDDKGIAFYFDKNSIIFVKVEIEEVDVNIWGAQLMFESIENVTNIINNNTDEKITIINDPVPSLFYCIKKLSLIFSFESNKLTTVIASDGALRSEIGRNLKRKTHEIGGKDCSCRN